MKKRNKKYVKKDLRMPKIVTQARDFAEVDKFMRMLDVGDVTEAILDGEYHIVLTTIEKETYSVLNAMTGWLDCFRALAKELQDGLYDETPMRMLVQLLREDKLVSKALVNQVKEVVEHQRKLYMKAPTTVINYVSSTLLED